MIDLWVRQPVNFMQEAMEEGFRNITWHIGMAMAKKVNPLAMVRAGVLAYNNNARLMLVDYAGAPEYTMFSKYDKPIAVYPTWSFDEDISVLHDLMRNPVGESKRICSDKTVPTESRPIFGQKHRVVVHRFDWSPANTKNMQGWMHVLREIQDDYPDCEMFLSGVAGYDYMFDWGFQAADFRPTCMAQVQIHDEITLPSGKNLRKEDIYDTRYADWFRLLGMSQDELWNSYRGDRRKFLTFCFRSAQWARHNFDKVEPFIIERRSQRREPLGEDFVATPSSAFVLPATRRRTMRNIGFSVTEGDKFLCDSCILHNSCKLYRANSVCTVKGSDTVALADSFGTRSADRIINGLDALLKLQAERLENTLEGEIPGEPDKEVTNQINSLFSNGVKLAKLLDPSLAPGTKVNVNVGVASGGQASVGVAQANPRQLVGQIVRELEASGVPRESIDGAMIKAALQAMGVNGADPVQAAKTVSAGRGGKKSIAQRAAEIGSPEDEFSPEEVLLGIKIIDGDLGGDAA